MASPLEKLKDLVAEAPDAREFAGLLKGGVARLKDATNQGNSLESRFDLFRCASHRLFLTLFEKEVIGDCRLQVSDRHAP